MSAKSKPILVAFLIWFFGSFPAAIEIKMILSIPKTISKKVKVSSATQESACRNISII